MAPSVYGNGRLEPAVMAVAVERLGLGRVRLEPAVVAEEIERLGLGWVRLEPAVMAVAVERLGLGRVCLEISDSENLGSGYKAVIPNIDLSQKFGMTDIRISLVHCLSEKVILPLVFGAKSCE